MNSRLKGNFMAEQLLDAHLGVSGNLRRTVQKSLLDPEYLYTNPSANIINLSHNVIFPTARSTLFTPPPPRKEKIELMNTLLIQ
jgi:hypothetical protein